MLSRQACGVVIALLAIAAGPVSAQEPRALIERAIKAAGGEVDVARQPTVRARISLKGQALPYTATGDVYFQSVTAFRAEIAGEFANEKESAIMTFDGTKAWVKSKDRLQEMPASDLKPMRTMILTLSPLLLPALLADKTVVLSPTPDGRVQNRPTKVVKASFPDKTEIHLHFDKESGLLVQKSVKIQDGGSKTELVMTLSDYREVGPGQDEKTLRGAGIDPTAPAVLAFLNKKVPNPAQVLRAAALVKQFGDDSFDVREKACQDVVALGMAALPLLERAQKDADAEVARRARDCVEVITIRNDRQVLAAAVRQVVWGKIEGGTDALLRLLPGVDEATAREIKGALLELNDRHGKPDPALVRALEAKDPILRAAAAAVLGKDDGAFRKQPGRRLFARGVKQPMSFKMGEGMNTVVDGEIVEMEFFNRIDAKLFAKP